MKCPECGRDVAEIISCEVCGEELCTYCVDDCGCFDVPSHQGEAEKKED